MAMATPRRFNQLAPPRGAVATMAAHSAGSILRPPGALLCSEPAQPPLPSPLATRAPRSGLPWRQYSPTRALVSVVTTSLPAYPTMLATRWSRWVLLSTSRYTVPGWTNWCRLGIRAVIFAKVDTEAERELAAWAGIKSIPTLMVFRERVLVFSQPGALPEPALIDLIEQVRTLDMAAVHAHVERATSA